MDSKVKSIVKVGMAATGAAGVGLGIFGGDTVALAGVWGTMMYKIARHHNVDLDEKTCVKTCAGIIASLAGYKLGCLILTHAVNALLATVTLGATLFLSWGVNGIVNALITYRLGKTFDKMYGEDGCATAFITIGGSVLRSFFAVPSLSELREVLGMIND